MSDFPPTHDKLTPKKIRETSVCRECTFKPDASKEPNIRTLEVRIMIFNMDTAPKQKIFQIYRGTDVDRYIYANHDKIS